MVRICFAFSLERKNEAERWFSLCCPVGMSVQEVIQMMRSEARIKTGVKVL